MNPLSLSKIYNPSPGWYRGDFHLHTTFSDGLHKPPSLARLARDAGLDFLAVTDHNAVGAFSEFGEDPGILIIPGIEVTLPAGHWNVFGMEGWQDWMEDICSTEIKPELLERNVTTPYLERCSDLGLINSINHPLLTPWEWRDDLAPMRFVHCLEIFNDPLWPDNDWGNPQAIELWKSWLAAGYRITAIGGSDFHFLPGEMDGYPGEKPGLPTTHVYARELSGAAILEGLKQRRVYVSLGPQLDFKIIADNHEFMIGSDMENLDSQIELYASAQATGEAILLRIVKNGTPIGEASVDSGAGELKITDLVDPGYSNWYLLEVLGGDGVILAITNPIFSGPPIIPRKEKYSDFIQL